MAASDAVAASDAPLPSKPPLGDIEDLVEKHPGVLSVVSSAPAARASLLDWYDANHRVLPWRRNRRSKHALPPTTDARDPDAVASGRAYWRGVATTGAPIDVPPEQYAYGVWVSEIMSQQTQIERVAQYWLRWTDRWPTAAALAAASQEEVNEMWAGLGYYRRARFLLNGARHVCGLPPIGDETRRDDATRLANIAASFPTSAKGLGDIPGVGPYTAAAVASIAFDEPIAAVDGNVIRVAARLACLRDGGDATKPGSSAARATRVVADALLDRERPGDHNQAMMELGATVCAPKNPDCEACPVREHCAARALRVATASDAEPFDVASLPEKAKKANRREEAVAAFAVEATRHADGASAFLLVRRPEGGLLGGLWEFPSVVMPRVDADEDEKAAAARAFVDALRVPGLRRALRDAGDAHRYAGEVTHVFSHVKQNTAVWHARAVVETPGAGEETLAAFAGESGEGGGREWRWVSADDVAGAGLSSGPVKVHALVTGKKGTKGGKTARTPPPVKESAIGKMFAAQKRRKTEEEP